MKRSFIAAIVLCLSLVSALCYAGSSSSRGSSYSSGGFSSRSYSSSSSYSRSFSSPSFSSSKTSPSSGSFSSSSFKSTTPSTGSFSSPTFKSNSPSTGSFSSKSFTPPRPVAPAPSYSTSGSRQYGSSYSHPSTVVEHHYYNSGPSMGHFWFWMWALDHNNNVGGYYNGYPTQPGTVGPGGAITPVVPVYVPLWERVLVLLLNGLLIVGVIVLMVWAFLKISRWADRL